MKKTYVKPIMEMEGFVPNEYVAACWKLTCGTFWCDYNSYNYIIGGDKYSEDDFAKCVNDCGKKNVIHAGGDKGYEDSSKYYHAGGWFGYHHELTITPVPEDDPHPNASN